MENFEILFQVLDVTKNVTHDQTRDAIKAI